MKKLLVLMLVLGLGAVASAGLDFGKDPGNPVLGIDDGGGNGAIVIMLGVSADVANPVVWVTDDLTAQLKAIVPYGTFNMGDLGFPELGEMNLWQLGWGNVIERPAGRHVTLTADVIGWGDTDMGLGRAVIISEDLSTILGSAFVVPEPMSLMLLGLGGLFLRRRK